MIANNVVRLGPKTYTAKLEKLTASGLDIRIAGTLNGYIDFAVTPVDQKSRTYSLTCDDARRIMAALGSVVADVQANCLFERDGLLIKCKHSMNPSFAGRVGELILDV